MTRLPRKNPALYARMYTPSGRLVHRTRGPNSQTPLCMRFPLWHARAIEGRKPGAHLGLIEFDPKRADRLRLCAKCDEMAGWSL